ncbi:MAG TPA: APC family permease, partial [Anaerolineae bacterium]|nr:APC family permease [Anaerolineae bacterium]
MLGTARRWLIGPPLPTERAIHERLGKVQALAVLSSDALSSVAYATEEILLVLVLAGSGAINLAWPIALAISTLLFIVASSYYQTVHAYPAGGGAYLVTKDNLGTLPSLVAGSSLLIDYVLTVAVSTSAGVAAITSAFPSLYPARVWLALAAVILITVVNLRGVRESGQVFAVPTYFFIVTMYLLILGGILRLLFYGEAATTLVPPTAVAPVHGLTAFLILRAFASGCTALTGIEAISDGVPIFKKPEADNAGKTLLWMVTILVSLFLGITWLSHQYSILPSEGETVISQLARHVFGPGPFYYAVQTATALILLLAANTSYSDFPRLSMWLARDRFLPRQLANLGDRLVYNNGIVMLGLLASLLITLFGASTHALIPLYAVGVFISFTLSQTSMVRRWWRLRTPGWAYRASFNGLGAVATGVVMLIIATTKFIHGAWIVLLLIPVFVQIFRTI